MAGVTPVVPATGAEGAAAKEEHTPALTAWVGMVVFLAAWSMLFFALFFAWTYLRVRSVPWRPAGVPSWPLAMALLASLALVPVDHCLARAIGAMQIGKSRALQRDLALATALGATFIALQTWSGVRSFEAGLRPQTGSYGALVYALYALHGAHVAVGTCSLAWLAWRARRSTRNDATALRLWRMYWRFVVVVWLAMVVLVHAG